MCGRCLPFSGCNVVQCGGEGYSHVPGGKGHRHVPGSVDAWNTRAGNTRARVTGCTRTKTWEQERFRI